MLIRPARSADASAIDALLDAAFGPDRHARTASRLRVGAAPILGPSLVADEDGGALTGSVQFWPIGLVSAQASQPLTLLGPLAVASSARSIGLGRKLLRAALTAADAMQLDPTLLIGDLSYYGPFGFTAEATGGWSLPGPVERERLLLRQRVPRPLPRIATVTAAPAAVPAGDRSQPAATAA